MTRSNEHPIIDCIDFTPRPLPDIRKPLKVRISEVAEKIGGFVRSSLTLENRDPIRNRRTTIALITGAVALTAIGVTGAVFGEENCETFSQSQLGYSPVDAALELDATLSSQGIEVEFQSLLERFEAGEKIEVCQ